MVSTPSDMLLAALSLALAMVFGALITLIVVELRKRARQRDRQEQARPAIPRPSPEEMQQRRDLVVQLMNLYSGVHSADAVSDFLNKELESRYLTWRVRIPQHGPGEIYDLDTRA
jgi:hypothetical protein